MTDNQPRLAHGGLMRCCVETWDMHPLLPKEEGSRIECTYCGSGMVLKKDNIWHWDGTTKAGEKNIHP